MYFWLYNETEQKYESVKAEIPMLFVQEEKVDSFAEDFREKNGITVSLNVNTADKTAVSYGYYTLLTAYDKIREKEECAMLEIIPASVSEVTKLVCPHCGEKVSRVGLLKESRVEGLTFKCKKCGMLWEVKSK
jgi:predicted RNA-binding Zn-ribbon protein involved in translation (DUF1610 family)